MTQKTRANVVAFLLTTPAVIPMANGNDDKTGKTAKPKRAPIAKFTVSPTEINLTSARDVQSLVAQVQFENGITEDVSN